MNDSFSEQILNIAFSLDSAKLGQGPLTQRRLKDLDRCFSDQQAYRQACAESNPLVYEVGAFEPGQGEGQLHAGLGILYPGKIGDEYFMTKGHCHAKRSAAEFYIGLSGEGYMLLEDEKSGASRTVALCKHSLVYVPGYTAHRTVNTGKSPLVYIGVYPADAGHDYTAIARRNFRKILIERNGVPMLIDRPQ